MPFNLWVDSVVDPLNSLGIQLARFVPTLFGAVLMLIIGAAISVFLSKLVMQVVNAIRLDKLLSKIGFERPLERAGLHLNSGKFAGEVVKWFLFFVFLLAAADILGLDRVSDFLLEVLAYLPNVVVAILILLVGLIAGHFLHRFVMNSVKAAGLMSAHFLAGVARWVVVVFAILAALGQLGIASYFISTLFTGFVAALAIALGLSFGLGGKDAARDLIDQVRKR